MSPKKANRFLKVSYRASASELATLALAYRKLKGVYPAGQLQLIDFMIDLSLALLQELTTFSPDQWESEDQAFAFLRSQSIVAKYTKGKLLDLKNQVVRERLAEAGVDPDIIYEPSQFRALKKALKGGLEAILLGNSSYLINQGKRVLTEQGDPEVLEDLSEHTQQLVKQAEKNHG